MAKSRGLSPILAFDVVDHGALVPAEERGDHEARPFSAPRGSEGENVFRAVVAKVVEMLGGVVVPAADVNPGLVLQEQGRFDISLFGPTCRTVKVVGVHGKRFRAREVDEEKERARSERTADDDSARQEQRESYVEFQGTAKPPHPNKPLVGRIELEMAQLKERFPKSGLILKMMGNVLRGENVGREQAEESGDGCGPIESPDVAGITRLAVCGLRIQRLSSRPRL